MTVPRSLIVNPFGLNMPKSLKSPRNHAARRSQWTSRPARRERMTMDPSVLPIDLLPQNAESPFGLKIPKSTAVRLGAGEKS